MNESIPTQPGTTDIEHLKLLTIFHYVLSGLTFLFACIPIIHLIMGLLMAIAPGLGSHGGPPRIFGLLFAGFALVFILAGWALAVIILVAGRFLSQRRHYNFCFVVACVECIFMPLGTVLGVFTILVLFRQSVKALFFPRPTW